MVLAKKTINTGLYTVKNEIRTLPLNLYKNQLKLDQMPDFSRPETLKLQEENVEETL